MQAGNFPRATASKYNTNIWKTHLLTLFLIPTFMALFNKSASAVIVAASAISMSGNYLAKPRAWRRLFSNNSGYYRKYVMLSPIILYALASCFWSTIPLHSLDIFAGASIVAAAGIILKTTRKRICQTRFFSIALACCLACSALIIFEQYLGLPLHKLLQMHHEPFVLKRAAICNTIFNIAILQFVYRKYGVAALFVLVSAALSAIYAAYSGTSAFGMCGFLLTLISVKIIGTNLTKISVAVSIIICITISPFIGTSLKNFEYSDFVMVFKNSHLRERIEIWNAFDFYVREAPFIGYGFGSSQDINRNTNGPAANRQALSAAENLHPHNAYLQVWVELGLIGVLGIGLILYYIIIRLNEEKELFLTRLSLCSFCVFVMLLSHSLWQPWWIATIFAAYYLIDICEFQLTHERSMSI